LTLPIPYSWLFIEVAEKCNTGRANTSSLGTFSSSVVKSDAFEVRGRKLKINPITTFSFSKVDSVKLFRWHL
jgi:hypothetical protein